MEDFPEKITCKGCQVKKSREEYYLYLLQTGDYRCQECKRTSDRIRARKRRNISPEKFRYTEPHESPVYPNWREF